MASSRMASARDFHSALSSRSRVSRRAGEEDELGTAGPSRSAPCAFIAATTWKILSRSARRAFWRPSQFMTSVRNASSFASDSFNSPVAASSASFISALTAGLTPDFGIANDGGNRTSGCVAACASRACFRSRSAFASAVCCSGLGSGCMAFFNDADAFSYSSSNWSRS